MFYVAWVILDLVIEDLVRFFAYYLLFCALFFTFNADLVKKSAMDMFLITLHFISSKD